MKTFVANAHLPVGPEARALPPVLIIADDLTGACDTAAAFLTKACSVRVFLGGAPIALPEPGSVVALTTESRNVAASEAAARVGRAARFVCDESSRDFMLFKKVDSALRGNVAAEVVSALAASRSSLALVAPAFPEVGRVVSNGTLHIRDVAQQDTCVDVGSLISTAHQGRIEVLPIAGVPELKRLMSKAVENGARIVLCDSDTHHDLERVAQAAMQLNQRILWTGSAGLARAVASMFVAAERGSDSTPVRRNGETLLLVGTDHPVTRLQLSQYRQHPPTSDCRIHQVDWQDMAAACIRETFRARPVAAMIITGGDTAAFVLATLDATAIRLRGEIEAGTPWGHIEGGEADGCIVVTKSGGFGQEDTLTRAARFCNGRLYEPA